MLINYLKIASQDIIQRKTSSVIASLAIMNAIGIVNLLKLKAAMSDPVKSLKYELILSRR